MGTRHSLQRALTLTAYGLGGIAVVGGVLDAFTNAVQLTSLARGVLLVATVGLWVGLELVVRWRGLRWRARSGTDVTLRSLGAIPRMFFVGVVVLFGGASLSSREPSTGRLVRTPDVAVVADAGVEDAHADAEDGPDTDGVDDGLDRPGRAFPTATVLPWSSFQGAACSSLYESGDSYRVSPPGQRGDACTGVTFLFHSNYLGILDGELFCAFRVDEQAGRLALVGLLARSHILLAAGERLHMVGCEVAGDRSMRVASRDVSRTVRCGLVANVHVRTESLCFVPQACALDVPPRTAGAEADALTIGDDERLPWRNVFKAAELSVDAFGEEWAHGSALNLRVNGQPLRFSDGRSFSQVCSDFPAFVVSRPDWETVDCTRSGGVERVHRLSLHVAEDWTSFDLKIERCTLPPGLAAQLEQPLEKAQ